MSLYNIIIPLQAQTYKGKRNGNHNNITKSMDLQASIFSQLINFWSQ